MVLKSNYSLYQSNVMSKLTKYQFSAQELWERERERERENWIWGGPRILQHLRYNTKENVIILRAYWFLKRCAGVILFSSRSGAQQLKAKTNFLTLISPPPFPLNGDIINIHEHNLHMIIVYVFLFVSK